MNNYETRPFLEVYEERIDRSKYNKEKGDYVKGSSIITEVPILINKHTNEKGGSLSIQIVTFQSTPTEVLFVAEVHNKDGSLEESIHVRLPQESCRDIGNVIGATIFDSKFRLGN